jgi:hypothetical protein
MTPLRRALALATVFLAGCAPATGTVRGKIAVNGTPLPAGLITFQSEVGNHDAFSAPVKDGRYETGPIPAGPCKVTVIHSSVARPAAGGSDLGRARTAGAVEVPEKYGRADTSGLTFTVKPGANSFDRDLTP